MENLHKDYFMAIVEAKSISKAAETLLLSQPYLSQYLARLERNLGVVLFDRTRLPIQLTPAGELYLEYLQEATRLQEKLTRDFHAISSGAFGRLTVGIPPIRGSYILPQIIPQFKKAYPNVELILQEGASAKLQTMLQRRVVDFVMINLSDYGGEMVYEPLITEKLLLIAPKDAPELQEFPFDAQFPASVPAECLRHLPFVSLKPTSNITLVLNNIFGRIGGKPNIVIQTDYVNTATSLAAEGVGFALNSEMGIRYLPDISKIRYFTIDSPPLAWTLAIMYHIDNPPSPIARYLINLIKQTCVDFRREVDEKGLFPQKPET